jgi:hypothetical protein
MRYLLPLILTAAAIGLFVVYTNPTYQVQVKALQVNTQSYDDALDKSQELKKIRDDLLKRYNTFSSDNKAKLEDLLPDNVDNIRLVIDINNIATRNSITVKNLSVGDTQNSKNSKNTGAVAAAASTVGTVDLGFTVTSDFDHFLKFLYDLEHSLRLIDIQKISFSVGETGTTDYSVTIRTYWLH